MLAVAVGCYSVVVRTQIHHIPIGRHCPPVCAAAQQQDQGLGLHLRQEGQGA